MGHSVSIRAASFTTGQNTLRLHSSSEIPASFFFLGDFLSLTWGMIWQLMRHLIRISVLPASHLPRVVRLFNVQAQKTRHPSGSESSFPIPGGTKPFTWLPGLTFKTWRLTSNLLSHLSTISYQSLESFNSYMNHGNTWCEFQCTLLRAGSTVCVRRSTSQKNKID